MKFSGLRIIRVLLLSSIVASPALGCAHALQPEIASVGPEKPQPAAPGAISAPFVQAGTIFSVQTNEPLDTYFTAPGTRFTATVVDPLFAADGQLVVPYGALVHGTVTSVGPYERPRLRVHIDSIDTVRGTVPLTAALRDAQHYGWLGPDPLEAQTSVSPAQRFEYPDIERRLPSPDLFSYQDQYGFNTQQPREIRVPRGALLELALVRPLVMSR